MMIRINLSSSRLTRYHCVLHQHHIQRWVLFSCTAFSRLLIVSVWFTFKIKNAFLQIIYFHLFGIHNERNNCSTIPHCSLMLIFPPRTVTMLSPTRWAHQSCSSLLTDLSVRKSAAVPTVTSPTTPTRALGFPSVSSAALK